MRHSKYILRLPQIHTSLLSDNTNHTISHACAWHACDWILALLRGMFSSAYFIFSWGWAASSVPDSLNTNPHVELLSLHYFKKYEKKRKSISHLIILREHIKIKCCILNQDFFKRRNLDVYKYVCINIHIYYYSNTCTPFMYIPNII